MSFKFNSLFRTTSATFTSAAAKSEESFRMLRPRGSPQVSPCPFVVLKTLKESPSSSFLRVRRQIQARFIILGMLGLDTTKWADEVANREVRFRGRSPENETQCLRDGIGIRKSRDRWLNYGLNLVGYKDQMMQFRTPLRLKEGQVLYLETYSCWYELCFIGEKMGKPTFIRNDYFNLQYDVFQLSRCKKPLPDKVMRSLGIPLPLEYVEVIEENLNWEDVWWSPAGVWIAGKEYILRRMRFMSTIQQLQRMLRASGAVERWLNYSLLFNTKGMGKQFLSSEFLKKGGVLYLETHSCRYELCFIGTFIRNDYHNLPYDAFRWSRCKKPLSKKDMQSLGVPLALEYVEVLEENLNWGDVRWSQTGVWIAGKEYTLVRACLLFGIPQRIRMLRPRGSPQVANREVHFRGRSQEDERSQVEPTLAPVAAESDDEGADEGAAEW